MYAQQFTNDLLASTIDMYNDGRGIGLTVFSPLMKKVRYKLFRELLCQCHTRHTPPTNKLSGRSETGVQAITPHHTTPDKIIVNGKRKNLLVRLGNGTGAGHSKVKRRSTGEPQSTYRFTFSCCPPGSGQFSWRCWWCLKQQRSPYKLHFSCYTMRVHRDIYSC